MEVQEVREYGPDKSKSEGEVEKAAIQAIEESDFPIVLLSDVEEYSDYSRQTVHDRLGDLSTSENSDLKSVEKGGRTLYYIEGSEDEARVHLATHTPMTATASYFGLSKRKLASLDFWWNGFQMLAANLILFGVFLYGGARLLIDSWPAWASSWIANIGVTPYPIGGRLLGLMSIGFVVAMLYVEYELYMSPHGRIADGITYITAHGQRWLLKNQD